ncbi:MAG: DUF1080 domain-containing protein [Bryobacteraceae bacterium]
MTVRLFALILTALLPAAPAFSQNEPNRKDWIQLFNGKDLTGWTPKITHYALGDNFGNTFRVEDGLMKVRYNAYDTFNGRFGHIFYKDKFAYYIIATEYRFTGEQAKGGSEWAFRNSGIMIHCQDPASIGKDQDFPISIEVQLLGGGPTGTRPTANVCTPGTNIVMDGKLFTTHCLNSKSDTFRGDQWVRVEAMVLGDSLIRHIVNGQTVLEYFMPQIGGGSVTNYIPSAKPDGKVLTEGYISLQSESHPVEFRKVELLNLAGCMDAKAKNYKSYFVKAENAQCQY